VFSFCQSLMACQCCPGSEMAVPHFPAMVLFAFLVSVVFGLLSRDTPRDRVIYGAKVFVAFVGIALLLGWVMYPAP
jgi:ABC-type uncharacterized transport system permease subunit